MFKNTRLFIFLPTLGLRTKEMTISLTPKKKHKLGRPPNEGPTLFRGPGPRRWVPRRSPPRSSGWGWGRPSPCPRRGGPSLSPSCEKGNSCVNWSHFFIALIEKYQTILYFYIFTGDQSRKNRGPLLGNARGLTVWSQGRTGSPRQRRGRWWGRGACRPGTAAASGGSQWASCPWCRRPRAAPSVLCPPEPSRALGTHQKRMGKEEKSR